MTGPTLHSLDKDLASHVAGCTEESRHVWRELRSLKRWNAAATGSSFALALTVLGVLLKNHLHL